eukprot:Lankesteria_metandrocarpae@DN785_c0_g1_i2.p1
MTMITKMTILHSFVLMICVADATSLFKQLLAKYHIPTSNMLYSPILVLPTNTTTTATTTTTHSSTTPPNVDPQRPAKFPTPTVEPQRPTKFPTPTVEPQRPTKFPTPTVEPQRPTSF